MVDILEAKRLVEEAQAIQRTRKSPPNWGRTVVVRNNFANTQLVRIKLPQPTDVTVYLQPATVGNDPTFCVPVSYAVVFGTGAGFAVLAETLVAPARGRALHVVANDVIVNSVAEVLGVGTYTAGAAAALGRPVPCMQSYNMPLDAVTNVALQRLPLWATQLQLFVQPAAAAATAQVQYLNSGGVALTAGEAASRYEQLRPIPPHAMSVRVTPAVVGDIDVVTLGVITLE